MDRKDLQEVIHEELSGPLREIADSMKKEKKKPDYLYLVVFCGFMLYLLYLMYNLSKSIKINLF